MKKFYPKTEAEIEIMRQGGKRAAKIKKALFDAVVIEANAYDIEALADKLIKQEGAEASFKKVPGYKWATCVNVNAGLVHGIPTREVVFKKGDVISVDFGIYFNGFHTDCSFTKGLEISVEMENFLKTGQKALLAAVEKTRVGNRIYDLSEAIETEIKKEGYTPIRALVGHGIGRDLHEDPPIPCCVPAGAGKPAVREESMIIPEGATLAIEVMYVWGSADVVQENDGWTISTRDGKIAALFEETVAVGKAGPEILTGSVFL